MLSSMVKLIKKIVILLIALACMLVGGLFAYENPEKISPVIKGFMLPSLSIGYYLALFLFAGVVIGFILSLWANQSKQFKLKRENGRLRKNIKQLDSQVAKSADSVASP